MTRNIPALTLWLTQVGNPTAKTDGRSEVERPFHLVHSIYDPSTRRPWHAKIKGQRSRHPLPRVLISHLGWSCDISGNHSHLNDSALVTKCVHRSTPPTWARTCLDLHLAMSVLPRDLHSNATRISSLLRLSPPRK